MKKALSLICALAFAVASHAQTKATSATIALVGDIMMGTTYPSAQLPAKEGRQLFVDAASILSHADIAAGNLEGTLCDNGSTKKKLSTICYAFRIPTSFAPRLSEVGFDFLSMANNHANDFGEEGLKSTASCLDKIGIKYAGVKGISESAIIRKNGITYGFCAFGHNDYTFRHQDYQTARNIITKLVNKCDVVIVSFHGGAEGSSRARLPYGKEMFYNEDRGNLREFAHFCVDLGADVVFGHGPHVCRAMELYKEHLIAYSLGNFCTPYGMNLSGISGYAPLLELTISNKGLFKSGQIHSFLQQKGVGPRKDPKNLVAKEIGRLTDLDILNHNLDVADNGVLTRNAKK